MAEFDAREMFASSQVAQLATVNADGIPHIVPIVFAVSHDIIYTAVDAKRKSSQRLRRMANIEANPAVSLIVDHYDEDWSQLWWVRAHVERRSEHDVGDKIRSACEEALREKYEQYRGTDFEELIVFNVKTLVGWSAADDVVVEDVAPPLAIPDLPPPPPPPPAPPPPSWPPPPPPAPTPPFEPSP